MTEPPFSHEKYDLIYMREREKSFSMERVYEKVRRERTLKLINQIGAKNILDIGCGPDPLLKYCTNISSYVTVLY